MKNLFFYFFAIVVSINSYSQEEYFTSEVCHCAMGLVNQKYDNRPLTKITTIIFEVPCFKSTRTAPLTTDLKLQFFEFLQKNHINLLSVFKGKSRISSIVTVYKPSKDDVARVLKNTFGSSSIYKNYRVVELKDFKYKKGKYLFTKNKAANKKVFAMQTKAINYLTKGID